jgi:primase-polymerase (primpol)-like protein
MDTLSFAHPFQGLPSDIPALDELSQWLRWVAWKAVQREPGKKPTKVPVDPRTGGNAATNDPSTWGTYEEAVTRAVNDDLQGVGFVLAEDCPIAGYDLDDCIDPETGEVAPWAQAVLDLGETYAEISPSGTGIRLFTRSRPEKGVASRSTVKAAS